jgi:hypothetical protein
MARDCHRCTRVDCTHAERVEIGLIRLVFVQSAYYNLQGDGIDEDEPVLPLSIADAR